MNAMNSLSLPHHDLDSTIRAANTDPVESISNPHNAIRGANSEGDTFDRPGRLSVTSAANRIRRFDDSLRVDHVGHNPIRVDDNRISVGSRDYNLDRDGYRRLCQSLGAPRDYLKKLPPKLRSEIVQYHVDQRHHITKMRRADDAGAVVSSDDRFLTLSRSDLQDLTGTEVYSTIVDAIDQPGQLLEVYGLSFTDELVTFEIVSRQIVTEVRPGDLICGGLRVAHSRAGMDATSIHSFALRLVCTNGLVHRECTGPRRTARTRRLPAGSSQAKDRQLEQIHRLALQSWSHTRQLLDSVARLPEETVTDPDHLFERFLRNGRMFSRQLIQRLHEAWTMENSETTAYGILNALTRVATHDSQLSSRQRRSMNALAGIFAQKNTHICPHCFSVISAVN